MGIFNNSGGRQLTESEKVQKRNQSRYYVEASIGAFIALGCLYGGNTQYVNDLDAGSAFSYMLTAVGNNEPLHIFPLSIYSFLWLLCGACLTALIVVYMENDAKGKAHYTVGEEHGDAHFNDMKGELTEFNRKHVDPFDGKRTDGPTNIILSKNFRSSQDERRSNLSGNGVIFGETRSGKSFNFLGPNLMQCPPNTSFVITDPSEELLKGYGKYLSEVKGMKVKIFNLVRMGVSNTYNPFVYLRKQKEYSIGEDVEALQELRKNGTVDSVSDYLNKPDSENDFSSSDGVAELVKCIIDNTGTGGNSSGGDQYWVLSATLLLKMLVYYVRDFIEPEEQNLATVVQFIRRAKLDQENGKTSAMEKLFMTLPDDCMAKIYYDLYCIAPPNTRLSSISSLAVQLDKFLDPAVKELTSSDTIDLTHIADEPTALFLVMKQDATDAYKFLMAMLFTQLFAENYRHAQTELPADRGMKLPCHLKCYIDEAKSVGTIPGLPMLLSTMSKYNMSTFLIFQGLSQVKTNYEKDWEEILGNCPTIILLKSQEETTTKYFSEVLLGKQTITVQSHNRNLGKNGGGGLSYQQTEKPLMTMDEIARKDPNKCIIKISGEVPILDDKFNATSHPAWKYHGDEKTNPDWVFHPERLEYYQVKKKDPRDIFLRGLEFCEMAKAVKKITPAAKLSESVPLGRNDDEVMNNLAPAEPEKKKAMMNREFGKIQKAVEENQNDPVIFAKEGPVHTAILPFLGMKSQEKYKKPVILFADNLDSKKILYGTATPWTNKKTNAIDVISNSGMATNITTVNSDYVKFQIRAGDYGKFKRYILEKYREAA